MLLDTIYIFSPVLPSHSPQLTGGNQVSMRLSWKQIKTIALTPRTRWRVIQVRKE